MKIPRDVYGRDLAAVLCRLWGYSKVNQVGSHIILQAETPDIIASRCPITSRSD